MAIKEDKHVKMMFNSIQKMPQVNAAELYVSSEPVSEVDTEMVQQTTMSVQCTAVDDGCTTMGGMQWEVIRSHLKIMLSILVEPSILKRRI